MELLGLEVGIVLALIVANGVFAMSEMALVSARRSRLQQLANEGNTSAAKALELAKNPDRFLSTVQIGITLIGILAGAFGGATLAGQISSWASEVEILRPYASAIGFSVVVAAITYLSLIVGELVPKRIALNNSEKIASLIARPMSILAKAATPVVVILSYSTAFVFKVLRIKPSEEKSITEEELKLLIEQGTIEGVFDKAERDIVSRVFRMGDRRVTTLMTPRPDIFWLDVNLDEKEILTKISSVQFNRFPVCNSVVDDMLGIVKAKEYLTGKLLTPGSKLEDHIEKPVYVPETATAFQLLDIFRSRSAHTAMIVDEFGAIQGMVTSSDFLNSLAGELAPADVEEALVVTRADGSLLIDGLLPIDELSDHISGLVIESGREYQTIAGFILHKLGRIPMTGDIFEQDGIKFEVVDMDGRRIDKILVSRADSKDV